ncbi:MAG: hypothetical protein IJ346_06200 [Clostridia bacterium]|nr:hypothetical protein [Clostridia bacterium]
MTVADLMVKLDSLKLKYNNFSLNGGYLEEGFCLAEIKGSWQVYYCERGSESIIGIFPTEDDACEFMLCVCKQESDRNRWF